MISALFKRAKQEPTPQERLREVRISRDQLDKKISHLEKKAEAEEAKAKSLVANKDKKAKRTHERDRLAAKACLQHKRLYETQIKNLSGTLENLDNIIITIEGGTSQRLALDALKTGVQTIKQFTQDLDVEKVSQIMEEVEEQLQSVQEISDEISKPIGSNALVDDDDIFRELDELEKEEEEAEETETVVARPSLLDQLPEVMAAPTERASAAARAPKQRVITEEERQLAELGAMMN